MDELELALSLESRENYVVHEGLRKLISAMVVRGLRDLNTRHEKTREDAVEWWFPEEKVNHVFSSYHCCHLLGLDYDAMCDFILHCWPIIQGEKALRPRTDSHNFLDVIRMDRRGRKKGKRKTKW